MKKLEEYVRSIPDFPEPGIIFRDVTSILQDADGLQLAIDSIQEKLKDVDVDVIAGTESRGFIFGVPVAYNLHKPFVPIRKKGKLPQWLLLAIAISLLLQSSFAVLEVGMLLLVFCCVYYRRQLLEKDGWLTLGKAVAATLLCNLW